MKGVLLVNLRINAGKSNTKRRKAQYLDEFLMDKYVIDVPYLLRALLVEWNYFKKTSRTIGARLCRNSGPSEGSPLTRFFQANA